MVGKKFQRPSTTVNSLSRRVLRRTFFSDKGYPSVQAALGEPDSQIRGWQMKFSIKKYKTKNIRKK